MKKYVIISGGMIQDAFARELIRDGGYDVILAADSGMEFLRREQIIPDIIIGDFDSVKPETLAYFQGFPEIAWETLNPVKDDTDTEFAIRYALEHDAGFITLLGATGTRLDHVLGNISILGIANDAGVPVEMFDANNRITMHKMSFSIPKEKQFGKYVSLIPYGGEVKGLTLTGMKYPLSDAVLGLYNSLGISNEITGDVAEITFTEGTLIAVESID